MLDLGPRKSTRWLRPLTLQETLSAHALPKIAPVGYLLPPFVCFVVRGNMTYSPDPIEQLNDLRENGYGTIAVDPNGASILPDLTWYCEIVQSVYVSGSKLRKLLWLDGHHDSRLAFRDQKR